jgi:hypothetical protein
MSVRVLRYARARPFGLGVVLAAALLAGAIGAAGPSQAQADAKVDALERKVEQLHGAAKYAEARALAERLC